MKKVILYCLFFSVVITAKSQYFLKGIIRDEKNNTLSKAKVHLHSSNTSFLTGYDGSFGLPSKYRSDSVTIELPGFEKQTLVIKTDVWLQVVLKSDIATVIKYKPKLISFTKDAKETARFSPYISDETYFKLVENEFVKTAAFPTTAFSLNVNKASYSNIRRFINTSSKVPPDAVRIEEMINYFNLDYEEPKGTDVFKLNSSTGSCPWNSKNKLLYIKLSAKKIDLNKIPPGNFVFLIDVSGSMDLPNRLPLLKEAFQLFVKNLRPIDKISIVTYGGVVGTWLEPTPGNEKEKINNALELLTAAGDTPGESAIAAAYKLATATFIPEGNNRVILATDGDFNVGQTSEKALEELISKKKETGIYLTCLGVGMGNFKDSKLETLAKRGNGNYAYLDDLHEAEKVLVHELTETLYAVADDAFINIMFEPKQISDYRLIGFDNKRDAIKDTSSSIDGGEIGSGGSTMALFEITPAENFDSSKIVGILNLKFHDPQSNSKERKEINYEIMAEESSMNTQGEKFAASVAMYGLKLKDSPYLNNKTWSEVRSNAEVSVDKSNLLQTEFLKLIDRSIKIYEPKKKKKKYKQENDE